MLAERVWKRASVTLLLVCASALASAVAQTSTPAQADQLRPIQSYIQQSWRTLRRSNERLASAAVDPKFPLPAGERLPVYVSRNEDLNKIESALRAQLPLAEFRKLEVRPLPTEPGDVKQHGLLYLPFPYVVPGGRFNEMYGWDSYFIQVGLLRAGEIELARQMTDNFIYEIENYGQILNANRTYYLTRSQPPFLTGMLLGVYRHTRDKEWLRKSLPAIETYYEYWTTGPHLVAETGLSRYYDAGAGPAPEVVADERDEQGRTYTIA